MTLLSDIGVLDLGLLSPMKCEGSKILLREEREGGRERIGLGSY